MVGDLSRVGDTRLEHKEFWRNDNSALDMLSWMSMLTCLVNLGVWTPEELADK